MGRMIPSARGVLQGSLQGSTQDRLFAVPGGWQECRLELCGVPLRLTIPADPDRVLDSQVEAMHQGTLPDEAWPDPYWAALWSAATPTAEAVLRATWPPGTRVLELGCGAGLVGLAALVRGCRVTFSDSAPQATCLALENARQNGFPEAQAQLIDWYDPPAASYDVILASDVLYHCGSHGAILRTIDRLLTPDGICWIGDPGRYAAQAFHHAAAERFRVALRDRAGQELGVPSVGEFQLFVLRRGDR